MGFADIKVLGLSTQAISGPIFVMISAERFVMFALQLACECRQISDFLFTTPILFWLSETKAVNICVFCRLHGNQLHLATTQYH